MTNTKIILVVVALALVVMAAVGIAFAQYINTPNQNSPYGQIPQQSYSENPNTGYYPPGYSNGYAPYPQQGAYPYRTGMGMGMMGRFW